MSENALNAYNKLVTTHGVDLSRRIEHLNQENATLRHLLSEARAEIKRLKGVKV